MRTTQSLVSTFLLIILSAACTGGPIDPTPTPTPTPSLHTSLWVDYPSVRAGGQQGVNVTVSDLGGKPVAAANVFCVVEAGDYRETYMFPITDPEGRTRIVISVPADSDPRTYSVTVTIVDKKNRSDEVETTFDAYP